MSEPNPSPEPGPQQARRARRRRAHGRQVPAVVFVVGLFVVGLFVGAVFVAVTSLPIRDPAATSAPRPSGEPRQPARPGQDTLLLVRHGPDGRRALGTTLLAAGEDDKGASVVFLPQATLVDIPGFGVDRLDRAYRYGGGVLVQASVENLLGIDIDHVATVSNSGLASLLARTGGVKVEVDERLLARSGDGSGAVRFERGAQFLDGQRLVEYWGFRQRGESELATFGRQQEVLGALLRAVRHSDALDALVSDGAPQLQSAAARPFLKRLLKSMAAAQARDDLVYTVLPVTPVRAGGATGGVRYQVVPEDVARLAEQALGGSVAGGGGEQAMRIQVLNGVGMPGIGHQVGRRLAGAGFRIVLTENARSFDFAETLILVHGQGQAALAAAREVRDTLGVGSIQVSRQPQSVVDLTIVVGADLVQAPPASGDVSRPPQEQTT